MSFQDRATGSAERKLPPHQTNCSANAIVRFDWTKLVAIQSYPYRH